MILIKTLNANLGYHTNFVNLLDCCAVAVPYSFDSSGLPFGLSVISPAWRDGEALAVASRLHRMECLPMGAGTFRVPVSWHRDFVPLAVAGAHLRGQPLNHQLIELGARFVRKCRTAPQYRLYALGGAPPAKPGLVRVESGGAAIELEIWELPIEAFGTFVAQIPAPLGIGSVELESGESVKGFLCESAAVAEAKEISSSGGWRAYVGA